MTTQDAMTAPSLPIDISTSAVSLPPPGPAATSTRLDSLDIFRGITIAAMMLVNNSGKGTAYAPLEHATWNGWTPTDLIFPFFLFIVGVAIPFSQAKRSTTATRSQLLGQIWLRALSIFLLGALLTATPFQMDPLPPGYITLRILRVIAIVFTVTSIFAILYPWKKSAHWNWIIPALGVGLFLLMLGIHFANNRALSAGLPTSFDFGNGALTPWKCRIPGVLQRIGICYGIAASIGLFCGWRGALFAAIIFCAAYCTLMFNAPIGPVTYRGQIHTHQIGSLTQEDNLARRIDEKLFRNHNYGPYPDNEGLLSTLPAIATPLLGICIGLWLRTRRPLAERCAGLLATGVLVAIFGCCLDSWLMPINKNIWTPSFVVFTAGMAMLGLGAIFWFVDVCGRRAWALPFRIYGMNAIAAYVAAGLVTKLGSAIQWTNPATGRPISLPSYLRDQAANAVHSLSAWLAHISPHLPNIDTPQNTSLAYAIGFVVAILLLMSILYVLKIFVKV